MNHETTPDRLHIKPCSVGVNLFFLMYVRMLLWSLHYHR